ncbi:MAG: OmpA family protein [Rhodobacter sp.]|nr:OmpA family protein [Rhodobacter sp.]
MTLPPRLIAPAAFAAAAGLAVLAATWAALVIESRTAAEVQGLMTREGLSWVGVTTDGLQVRLAGTAPTEALRFRAVNLTAGLVEAGRIRDRMDVTPAQAIQAPRFSVELLRNNNGISLIGLVPAAGNAPALAEEVAAATDGAEVADMLTRADYPAPEGWDRAVSFGLTALAMLPQSKISIDAGRVSVTAISGSEAEKLRLEAELDRARPKGLAVGVMISAPRPVLTPFTLRFLKDDRGARFDACSADTEAARNRIVIAAVAAGLSGEADCTIGLGVPTPRWAEAAEVAIRAVGELGAGSVTFSDADVSLLATLETPQAVFDRIVGELEAALPDVFSLKATLPEKPQTSAPEGPAEFIATLSADGAVQLRGRLTDATLRDAVSSFAAARFGAADVYMATRLDPGLPEGWPVRVLAGLQAMSEMNEGQVIVRADSVEVTGVTALAGARAAITRTLSVGLGQGQAFTVEVRYDEALDPQAALPTPQECVTALNSILQKQKIAFAPGSAEIESAARDTMDALADQMRKCPDIAMEIGGHTDSQGRDSSNLALSQARAEAVLLGLQGRRVLVGSLTAVGYGETRPLADNDSPSGRETNRRIEFTLPGQAAAAAAAVSAPVQAPLSPGADASAPPASQTAPQTAPQTEPRPGGAPAAAAPAPAEPFVSSAPDEPTPRARQRPEAE